MQTECNADLFGFAPVESRAVVAAFNGGRMTSDAGALLLGATDRAIGLVDRFAECFTDGRAPELVEHEVGTMVGQRIFGIALGYEDLVDHDQLRHDPTMAVLAGKLVARRKDCAPLAGKSTLNRLELGGPELTRYHRIAWDGSKVEALFVNLFLEAHPQPPKQITLDLDATDDPLHGHQEGRFFHGYYDCYCYLPLYIFCGTHLLAAKQRCANVDASAGAVEETARIVAQIRARWPEVRVCCAPIQGSPASADGLVRAQQCRFCLSLGQKRAPSRRDLGRTRRRRGRQQSERPAGTPVERIPVVDARQLEPPAPRHRQGRVDAENSWMSRMTINA
jgi:Transposase DDE domain group 1